MGLLDRVLVGGVQAGCRLVEHQHRPCRGQGPRDRDALPLATRQFDAALADQSLKPLGQSLD
jgi:hypothetical protein